MAGTALTTKETSSNTSPWAQKAMGAVQTAGKVLSIAHGIREAIPVVQGVGHGIAQGIYAARYGLPFLI